MPIRWTCPGAPDCTKVFLYASPLRAHVQVCRHANDRRVNSSEEAKKVLDSILDVMTVVEDQQRGNITICRRNKPFHRPGYPTYARQWPETNGYCVPKLKHDL